MRAKKFLTLIWGTEGVLYINSTIVHFNIARDQPFPKFSYMFPNLEWYLLIIIHCRSMLKLLDVLVQLDHLKNAKASIPNDFSWYKRYIMCLSIGKKINLFFITLFF